MLNVSAYAKIQMTVEVQTPACYGADWTLDKVQEQVAREAVDKLNAKLPEGVRVIGQPTVVQVCIVQRSGS